MKFLALSFLFIFAACNDAAPKLSELGATNINGNDNISFTSNYYDIASPNDALEVSGRCDPRHHYLEVSVDGAAWVNAQTLFGSTGSDLNCSDGTFVLLLPKVADFFQFQSGTVGNQGKTLGVRGNLGFTQTSSKHATIRSGDFSPPGIPKFNTISDYENPKIRITGKPTDTDISHYECRWGNTSWIKCFEKEDPENKTFDLTGLSLGEETTVQLRAVDVSGNIGETYSKSIRRGQIGRGFDGQVKGVLKVADDRYLAYGDFNYYEAEVARGFARLSPEGVFDPSFKIGFGLNTGSVSDFDFDSDGNIFLIGSFTEYSKRSNQRITKLMPNGEFSLDFATNSGFTGNPSRIQNEGSDLFRIDFLNSSSSTSYRGLNFTGNSIRIDAKGNKDASFVCPSSVKYLHNIIRTSSGDYAHLSSAQTSTPRMASLAHYNSNCEKLNDILDYTDVAISMDNIQFYDSTDYETTSWNAFTNIFSMNNKLYIGGNFNSINKNSTQYAIPSSIAEFSLNPNEPFLDSLLTSAVINSVGSSPTDFLRTWYSITSFNDNLLILSSSGKSGAFYLNSGNTLTSYDNATFSTSASGMEEYANRLYAINTRIKVASKTSRLLDTTLDNTFSKLNLQGVNRLKFHSNYLYTAGSFLKIRNLNKLSTNLILIDGNGNLVKAYTGVSKLNSTSVINQIVPYGDKLLVGGSFTQMLGTTRNSFAALKMKPDFSLEVDPSFPNINISDEVIDIAIDSEQSIYLSGYFIAPKRGIVKLQSNGSIDTTFKTFGGPSSSSYARVYSMAIANDKIYLSVPSKFITDLTEERNCSSILVVNKNGEFQNCITTHVTAYSLRISENKIFYTSNSPANLSQVYYFDHTASSVTGTPLVHSTSCPGYVSTFLSGATSNFGLQTDENSITFAFGRSTVKVNKATLACEKITPVIKEGYITGMHNDEQSSLIFGNFTLSENSKSHHSLMKIFNSNGNYTIDTQSFGDEH